MNPQQDCPFCYPNWKNLDIVEQSRGGSVAVIRPLDPVTDGHVLVIHASHAEHVAERPGQGATLMEFAARYVHKNRISANIITSVGAPATQTVKHTHIHIVPRTEGDGLTLPWTGQKKTPRKKTKREQPERVSVEQGGVVLTDDAANIDVDPEELKRQFAEVHAIAGRAEVEVAGPSIDELEKQLADEAHQAAETKAARALGATTTR
jgi:diadenosine tetraphosphate (Ap4A) HIT family hydrolase